MTSNNDDKEEQRVSPEEALERLPDSNEFEDEFKQLPVKHDDDTITIDTTDDALQAIDAVARERDEHTEIEYLNAVRKVVKYADAPGFDVETGEDGGAQLGDGEDEYTDPTESGLRSGKGNGLLRRLFRDDGGEE